MSSGWWDLDKETQSWPWEKHSDDRSTPTLTKSCPCDRLIVMPDAIAPSDWKLFPTEHQVVCGVGWNEDDTWNVNKSAIFFHGFYDIRMKSRHNGPEKILQTLKFN